MSAWKQFGTFGHELLLALLLVAMLIVTGIVDRDFISASNQQSQFFNVWDLALLSLPMTLIIITGGIDLSVGSTMALTSVVLGMFFDAGWPIWLSAVAAICAGALCGMINGLFITKVRVHPLIVTLATYSAFRGLAEGLSLGLAETLKLKTVYGNFPKAFKWIGKHAFLMGTDPRNPPAYALSLAGWLFGALAIFVGIVLARTPFGRSLYAIGHNETATRFSGIKVDRIKMIIYTFSGLMAGLVTINYAAFNNSAQATVGSGIELDVITAVVLGGTSIFGGRGRIIGTVLGVALIHETREFVSYHYSQNELIRVVLGGLLLVAVAANALLGRKAFRK
jgi:rhamnose transport system permease protein